MRPGRGVVLDLKTAHLVLYNWLFNQQFLSHFHGKYTLHFVTGQKITTSPSLQLSLTNVFFFTKYSSIDRLTHAFSIS